ncbi:MAG: DUF4238 domain-containing protein [Saprospiraceae bacterium]|uniref:DUF4238 domain-containing protein n=1 Tax=Candidatus Opimibacter skivensis TaxID=2982028 RepID=A0A9D7SWQ4_9BACT|nr:DUF4238 domain-containing protein [Candidatus Opimibacter skivensis]
MLNRSKKHHFNPQGVLKNFSIDGKQVFVLDKLKGHSFKSSLADAGSENYFNSIRVEDSEFNFETLFDVSDQILSEIVEKLVVTRSLGSLDEKEIAVLNYLVVVQLIRTKRARTESLDLSRKVNEFTKKIADQVGAKFKPIPELDEEEAKLITMLKLSNIRDDFVSISEKDIVLLDSKGLGTKL